MCVAKALNDAAYVQQPIRSSLPTEEIVVSGYTDKRIFNVFINPIGSMHLTPLEILYDKFCFFLVSAPFRH